MMTPKRRRAVGPVLLAATGIAVMLTGIGLHWWNPDRHGQIEWIPQLIGAAIAFVGFYGMDPKGAKDGGAFIVDAGTRIVGMIQPGGRRSTDAPVMTPTAAPSDGTTQLATTAFVLTSVSGDGGTGGTGGASVPGPDTPPTGGFPPAEQPHDVAPLVAIPAKERGDL
jgi:hypothetical protein